jgi:hypothetical protein
MRMAVVSGEEDHFPTRTSPEYSHPAKRAFYAGLLGRRKQDSPLQLLMFKRASLVPVLSLRVGKWSSSPDTTAIRMRIREQGKTKRGER